jgi:hypothetical protein
MSQGVYFLANDAMSEMVIAFLNSFRCFNPGMPLCLIPFDSNISWLRCLQAQYDFSVFERTEILEWCDHISRQFHDVVQGHYRKLACWFGPFERFIYVDADTVVLRDLSFSLELLQGFGFLTSHSDMPQIRKWVWRDSISQQSLLSGRQIVFAANTGYIVSARTSLSREQVNLAVSYGLRMKEHMEPTTAEQPFLNVVIVTSGLEYSSIYRYRLLSNRRDVPREQWGGFPELDSVDGKITATLDVPIFLVHWAGEWRSGTHLRSKLWNFYRHAYPLPAAE